MIKADFSFKTLTVVIFFTVVALFTATPNAYALSYKYCNDPSQSPACFIALEKLKTLDNPITGQKFFDDGIHYSGGKVFVFPDLNIAETDLDNDGFKEIIVRVPEMDDLLKNTFCKENNQCPHFIFQDRNTDRKPNLKNIKVMGPIYTAAIGLSTDEIVGGFRSLRAYTDFKTGKFNVYQYDKKADDYFNITALK